MGVGTEFDLHYALLNPQQRRAVDHADGPLLVLAGAGTGKTQLIALRIAKLLATHDLEPRNILCLTFTESGVHAMRERLVKLLGSVGYHVPVATFHGFCNEIIAAHPERFVAQAAIEPISDLDRLTSIQACINALPADSPLKPFGAPDFYIPDIIRAIQTLKRENVTADQLRTLAGEDQKVLALAQVYEQYQERLRSQQVYDYEDMILFVIQAFSESPELLAEYQEQYLYMLVDEFQDTNGAQNEIIRLLVSGQTQPNICVVGDDRQSIYRFQGAALENILAFQQRYGAELQLVTLTDNYRSQQWILDAASAVISQNRHSLREDPLSAARDSATAPIELAALSSISTELFWLSSRVRELIETGVVPQDIAVLCRTNSDAASVFDQLSQAGIPVHISSGSNVLADPLIQQLVRLLRYVGLGGHDEALFSIVHSTFLQLPVATIAQLAHDHKNLWLGLQSSDDPAITAWVAHMLQWRATMHNQLCTHWFTQVVEESGWLRYVLTTDHALEHLNRLSTLFHAIQQLTRAQPTITIKDVMEYLQLLQHHNLMLEEEPLQTQAQAVRVMTAHRAKGLEFAHVFLMRCQDKKWGNVPDRSKLKLPVTLVQAEPKELLDIKNEDERRLWYVAMTRAKQRLYLSYAKQSDSGRAIMPSQFIAEIPEHLLIAAAGVTEVESEPLERLKLAGTPPTFTTNTTALREYVQGILADYTMSATHLNDYLTCPRLFLYQDLLRVPRATTRAVGFGIAVHNVLKQASERKLTLPQVLKLFKAELERQLLSQRDVTDSLAFGELTLRRYYPDHKNFLGKNRFPEKDFRPYHVRVNDVPIVGKIDAIHVLDEQKKIVHVVDYKTGNPDNKGSDLAKGGNYHRQLVFYKLLCDHTTQFGYTAVSGEIHFIQQSKKKKEFVSRGYEFTEDDVERVTAEIGQVYQHIQQLDFLDPAPAELCGECQWCLLWSK